MLEHLDVPFRDASADQLVWELDAAPQPWLARRQLMLGHGVRLDLRLLGASHQVLVEHLDRGSICSELVACRPAAGGTLPPQATADRHGIGYRFASWIERVGPEDLAARAAALLEGASAADGDRTLVGAFPGSPHAVTAISVAASGWRTWHVYPQTGEIVTTETVLTVRGAAPLAAPASTSGSAR